MEGQENFTVRDKYIQVRGKVLTLDDFTPGEEISITISVEDFKHKNNNDGTFDLIYECKVWQPTGNGRFATLGVNKKSRSKRHRFFLEQLFDLLKTRNKTDIKEFEEFYDRTYDRYDGMVQEKISEES